MKHCQLEILPAPLLQNANWFYSWGGRWQMVQDSPQAKENQICSNHRPFGWKGKDITLVFLSRTTRINIFDEFATWQHFSSHVHLWLIWKDNGRWELVQNKVFFLYMKVTTRKDKGSKWEKKYTFLYYLSDPYFVPDISLAWGLNRTDCTFCLPVWPSVTVIPAEFRGNLFFIHLKVPVFVQGSLKLVNPIDASQQGSCQLRPDVLFIWEKATEQESLSGDL